MKSYKTIIQFISWILLIGVSLLLFMRWNEINSIVGIHVNLQGNIDSYGTKMILLILLAIGYIVHVFAIFQIEIPIIKQLQKTGLKSLFITHTIYFLIVFVITSFIEVRVFIN